MADYQIRTRIPEELETKLNAAMEEVKKKSPRGAEVTTSSIVRSSLEKFVEDVEKEKNNVITVDFPLNELTKKELLKLNQFLGEFYASILNRKAEENPVIKNDNTECYKEMLSFSTISEGSYRCLRHITQTNLRGE